MYETIFSIGLTLQIIFFMLRNEFEMESGLVWFPSLLTIGALCVAPVMVILLESSQSWGLWQIFFFVLCGFQILLFIIKGTTAQDLSWWVVFFPLLIVFGIVLIPLLIAWRMKKTTPEGYF